MRIRLQVNLFVVCEGTAHQFAGSNATPVAPRSCAVPSHTSRTTAAGWGRGSWRAAARHYTVLYAVSWSRESAEHVNETNRLDDPSITHSLNDTHSLIHIHSAFTQLQLQLQLQSQSQRQHNEPRRIVSTGGRVEQRSSTLDAQAEGRGRSQVAGRTTSSPPVQPIPQKQPAAGSLPSNQNTCGITTRLLIARALYCTSQCRD